MNPDPMTASERPALNLPPVDFRIRIVAGKEMIFDPVRGKYVRLTPEEWVRQHFMHYLIHDRGAPRGLVAVEPVFPYEGMPRRADVIVHDRAGKPLLMVECKAPAVEIGQAVFDQVARYNTVVRAKYLVVTNGLVHYCWVTDRERGTHRFLDAIPPYEAL